ncbi:MAG TPA: choice-of-anchor L domain-containing protein [Rhodocyclaceae bacterium]|nr:choice-of-anchor L domain-containing protein [Rhodocyclaceae bacterium]
MKKLITALCATAACISAPSYALVINTSIGADASTAATTLTNTLLGGVSGIHVTSSSYVGNLADSQSATYTGLNLVSNTGGPTLSVGDGIFLTSGTANIPFSNTSSNFSTVTGSGGDAQVSALLVAAGGQSTINDVNSLTINFTADAGINALTTKFLYGSEEFPDQGVTDFFMFILDGVNYAKFPDGSLVSFVNGVNAANFISNGNGSPGPYAIEYDGLSNGLGVTGLLDTSLTTHTLKVVTGDTLDSIFDSGVFIASLAGTTTTGPGGICGGVDQPACPGNGVPEPGSLALAALALVGLASLRRKSA